MAPPAHRPFVSRAGLKLDHALREFRIDVRGRVCADFGCNVGGFTDCLLHHGAARVYAIDTGYGTLAWPLRSDQRVVVMERTNALHAEPPAERIDLVTIDLAWTRQRLAVPAALRWLRPPGTLGTPGNPGSTERSAQGGLIISLIKPHYELDDEEKLALLMDGMLPASQAPAVLDRVLAAMPSLGARVMAHTPSPLTGGKSSRRAGGGGNIEFLALLAGR